MAALSPDCRGFSPDITFVRDLRITSTGAQISWFPGGHRVTDMARTSTFRRLFLVSTWIALLLHASICEIALASAASPNGHLCCGRPSATQSEKPVAPNDNCGDCAACFSASAPEELAATISVFQKIDFFHPAPLPIAPSLPPEARHSVHRAEADTSTVRRFVSSLINSPNAPPASMIA